MLDYIEWLFGTVESLAAALHTAVPERRDESSQFRSCTAPDNAHLLLRTKSHVPAVCTVSNVDPCGSGHWVEVHGSERTWIIGSSDVQDYGKGFRAWEGRTRDPQLAECTPDLSPFSDNEDGRIAMMIPLIRRFLDAIRTGKHVSVPSFTAGVRTQVLLEAIQKANRNRCWVDIPES
jgi:predicted dehydrogenase